MNESIVKTKIIAHRGFSEKYPENTLIAFEKAVAMGADGIELDVHVTKDKKLVVHHDYYLGKMDNGRGLICEKKWNYLKHLDAGSWFRKKFRGEKTPLLNDVFRHFGSEINYEIELKEYSLFFGEMVVKLARKYDLLHKCEFTSHSSLLLAKLKQLIPSVKIGRFIDEYLEWMELKLGHHMTKAELILGKFDVAHCPISIATKPFVADLKKSGIKVHIGNRDTIRDIRRAYQLGADQISTNKLMLALRIRKDMQKIT